MTEKEKCDQPRGRALLLHLYHGKTSVCSAKVRVGLAELELDWTGQILDLGQGEQNEDWYLAFNPKGVVPTLIDDELVVVESSVILEYIAASPGANLMPSDPKDSIRAKMWLSDCIDVHAAINTMTFATSKRRQILALKTPDEIASSIAKMANPANANKRRDILANGIDSEHVAPAFFSLKMLFEKMESSLASSTWLLSDRYSLADTSLIAYVDRLDRLGLSGMWSEKAPNVMRWLANSRDRESYSTAIKNWAGPPEEESASDTAGKNWEQVARKWADFIA